jgi:hypothetical protein
VCVGRSARPHSQKLSPSSGPVPHPMQFGACCAALDGQADVALMGQGTGSTRVSWLLGPCGSTLEHAGHSTQLVSRNLRNGLQYLASVLSGLTTSHVSAHRHPQLTNPTTPPPSSRGGSNGDGCLIAWRVCPSLQWAQWPRRRPAPKWRLLGILWTEQIRSLKKTNGNTINK